MRSLPPGEKSHGAILLGRVGRSQDEIARDVGKSRSLVGHWRNGVRVPTGEDRCGLRRLYGIAEDAWDELPPLPGPAAPTPSVKPAELDDGASARERALALSRKAAELLKRVESDQSANTRDQALAIAASKQAIELLMRCELDQEKIIRSPEWRRIQSMIVEALRPFPEAADAVREALRSLRGL